LLNNFNDIHTHIAGKKDSILSVPPEGVESIVLRNLTLPSDEQQYYSIQLHPWHLGPTSIQSFQDVVERYRDDLHFIAIGECGLDGLCSTPLSLQQAAFQAALEAAHELDKPVVIHCVKLWNEVITAVRPYILKRKAAQQFIIHGFRKGPQLAQRLLDAGFSISLGKYYHQDIPTIIPKDNLFYETDEE